MSRSKPSGDAAYDHALQIILNNNKYIRSALTVLNVQDYEELLDVCSDPGKFASVKWKDPQTQQEASLDEDKIEELEAFLSFVNYLQNDHGRVIPYPIDITQFTRRQFRNFLRILREDGGGKVLYDPVKALISEQRNFPTPPSGTTAPPVINAASAKPSALDALNKKLVLKKELCPVLTSKLGWKQWKTRLTAQCKLCDNENPLDANYQVPAGDEDLDKKQCILLYTIFQTNVTSVEGTAIVDKHANTMDGRACFADLVKEHEGNISAKNQARKLKKRLNLVQVPETLKKPLFSYLTDHENWVRGYNSYCHPSKVMDDDDRLDSLENYLALVPGIDSVRRQMDITDIHGSSRNLSAAERIEYYYDFARDQDDHTKEDQTTPRRRANISELSINAAGMTFCGVEESFDPSDFEEVDPSMSVAEYEVNAAAAGQQRRFGFIHPDDYKSVAPESRRKFLSIPAKDREIIITSESSRAATSSKPSPPTNDARPGLRTGVTNKNARVNADISSPDDNGEPLVPVQEEDAPAQIEAKMSISRCIAQGPIEVNSARSTLPPAIATRIFGSNIQKHDCRDTRRMMSDQNTIELPRRPIAPPSTPRKSSTPVTASSALSHHPLPQPSVTFPDILGGSTRRGAFATEGNYGPAMVEVDAAVTDDVTALGEAMHADVDDTIVIAASALMLGIAGLIDGGANGGLASPTEMRRIRYAEPSRKLNIEGVGDHNIEGLPIGTYAAKVRAADGWILAIFPEYGELINGGTTIHSGVQLRDGGCRVDDVPKAQGGAQLLQTKEGFVIPLDVENGLVYMKMHYPSDEDMNDPSLPHVVMTRDVPWDPGHYDSRQSGCCVGRMLFGEQ